LKRLANLRQLTFFVLISLLISSCTKEFSPIGKGLLSEQDMLSMGYTDTIKINAYSILSDSIYTRNLGIENQQGSIYYAHVGSMYDPIFGRTTANLYTQLSLNDDTVTFGTNPKFDSAFLYLPYMGSYGDTMSNLTLRVYSLTESIIDSIHCYSGSTIKYDKTRPIGEITFQPRPNDSSYFNGVKLAKTLRIPINANFGNFVLNPPSNANLINDSAFVKFYKGLCIIAEPENTSGKGSILMFGISSASRLQMYYQNNEKDSLNRVFAISPYRSKFQTYNHHGYNEAIPMLKNQVKGDTLRGKQFLFAQGLAGAKIKIQIPTFLKSFEKGKVIINDAQLVLGNGSISNLFPNPSSITLRSIGVMGSTNPYPIVDDNQDANFDGNYNASTNSYRFRITRYLQYLVEGKVKNTGLHLIVPTDYQAHRLVLNGTSSPQSDLKLYIRYTKLK